MDVAHDNLIKDKKFVLEALKINSIILEVIDESLMKDPDVIATIDSIDKKKMTTVFIYKINIKKSKIPKTLKLPKYVYPQIPN